jgi:hypothetical protein
VGHFRQSLANGNMTHTQAPYARRVGEKSVAGADKTASESIATCFGDLNSTRVEIFGNRSIPKAAPRVHLPGVVPFQFVCKAIQRPQ